MLTDEQVDHRLRAAGRRWRVRFDAHAGNDIEVDPAAVPLFVPPSVNPGRWPRTRLAVAVAASTAVIVLVAVTVAVLSGNRSLPVAAPTPAGSSAPAVSGTPSTVPSPTASAASSPPAPPADLAELVQVGIDGTVAWQLRRDGVQVTTDLGRHWSQLPLPARISAASVTGMAADRTSGVWLSVPTGNGVTLYHRKPDAAGWTQRELVLPPNGIDPRVSGPAATIRLGPGHLVTVVVGYGLTASSSYSRIFVSADGGATFTRHPAPDGDHLMFLAYADPAHAVAVTGPTGVHANVYATSDGGEHWQQLTLPVRVPVGGQAQVEIIAATPTAITLSEFVNDIDGNQDLTLLTSTDGGATFAAQGQVLHIPADRSGGDVTPAMNGPLVWLRDRGQIIQSTDAGTSWTGTATGVLVDSFSVLTDTTALGVATVAGCAADCGAGRYLVMTSDSGRTWHTLAAPSR